jgi:cytochrome b pre-mRNA-processing protein 3
MGVFPAWFGRRRHERAGFTLYAAAVAAARDPYYYRDLGVPDTLDGRFDLVGLFAFLVIERLRDQAAPGPDLAQAVFDAMFSDMDVSLREIGVGDLSVGKRVKDMWEAFHGRSKSYQAALAEPGNEALSAALARNVWRGAAPDARSDTLAVIVRRQTAALSAIPLPTLARGEVKFSPALEAATA